VVPQGILPPETGATPRDEADTRPLLFLADDFRRRVESPEGVRYILQLQLRDVPADSATRDVALDCTRPWGEAEFPYVEVGEMIIDRNVPTAETEKLEFKPIPPVPRGGCHFGDVVQAERVHRPRALTDD
jgi:catalase